MGILAWILLGLVAGALPRGDGARSISHCHAARAEAGVTAARARSTDAGSRATSAARAR